MGTVHPMSDDDFTPYADELIANNVVYAESFDDADLQVSPTRQLALVVCMDSRIDVFAVLGLGHGEAHVIRNAGGVITDDVVRSLCLSQRALGTREIVLVHHTDCGLQKVREDDFRAELARELGITPTWTLDAFPEPAADVAQSIRRLRLSPFVDSTHVRGFVYDVETGLLSEVTPDDHPV